ncbi:hypothetical protein Tco_0883560, partial [Tanacetum coccineum]
EDPYKAIRQAYLVGTDTESEPIEAPESPHPVASPTSLPDSTPPTCHVEVLEGSDTSGARSTSSDSTAPLSPDHPLTNTTPTLVPVLCRTARMAVRVPPAMSPGLFANLPSWKRYRGTFELVEDDEEEDEEIGGGPFGILRMCEPGANEGPPKSMGVESLTLGGDEVVPRGQQRAAPVVETVVGEPLGLGYRALRCREIVLGEGRMPSVFEVR